MRNEKTVYLISIGYIYIGLYTEIEETNLLKQKNKVAKKCGKILTIICSNSSSSQLGILLTENQQTYPQFFSIPSLKLDCNNAVSLIYL